MWSTELYLYIATLEINLMLKRAPLCTQAFIIKKQKPKNPFPCAAFPCISHEIYIHSFIVYKSRNKKTEYIPKPIYRRMNSLWNIQRLQYFTAMKMNELSNASTWTNLKNLMLTSTKSKQQNNVSCAICKTYKAKPYAA